MQSILHKFVLASAAIAATALATNSAMAETTIKVPFAFTVAGQAFPAGRYLVQRDDSGGFVTVQQEFARRAPVGFSVPAHLPLENKIAVNFDAVGHTHVLQSIQYGSMITSRLGQKERGKRAQRHKSSPYCTGLRSPHRPQLIAELQPTLPYPTSPPKKILPMERRSSPTSIARRSLPQL